MISVNWVAVQASSLIFPQRSVFFAVRLISSFLSKQTLSQTNLNRELFFVLMNPDNV